jgi:hypothetical protein
LAIPFREVASLAVGKPLMLIENTLVLGIHVSIKEKPGTLVVFRVEAFGFFIYQQPQSRLPHLLMKLASRVF